MSSLKKIPNFRILLLLLKTNNLLFAQTNVSIDLNCQRFIGNISTLDRTKYFTIHDNGSDADIQQFMSDYNVTVGRGFWAPYSYANSQTGTVGVYPAPKTGNTNVRPIEKGFVATEHPSSVIRYNLDMNAAADWAVEYYKNFTTGNRPEYFEPMNEPFVHAGDAVFSAQQSDDQLMRERMADWFGAIGQKFDQTPELANMKIIGYSSAWPSMELWDFGHWNTRMKMFMDRAGDHIDAFSTHLYDGVNVTGQVNQRSGSNSEAILDLIETYSYAKWGIVKEHAITEYGLIESGFPDEYSDLKFIQAIKGQNHLVFGLLDREDNMAISIPFTVGKSTWHITQANNYHPYGAALFRPLNVTPTGNPNKPTIGGWEYTSRIHFYELWKDVQGDRVSIESSDPDIFVQAFVDNNMAYICLNNIENNTKTVDLNFLNNIDGLTNVNIKSLKIYIDKDPVLSNTNQATSPATIDLIEGETVIMAYQFSSPIIFNNAIRSKKYHTAKHLQAINANTAIDFNFNGVVLDTMGGMAILKMGIGRKHDRSKSPEITVNGTVVSVPSDWKGYDQSNRTDFFGTIEIPFSIDLLQSNNVVSIKFPDGGGRVSSLILEVKQYDNQVTNTPIETLVLTQSAYDFDEETTDFNFEVEYSSNVQREVFVELKAPDGTWLGGVKKVVEAGTNVRTSLTLTIASQDPGMDYKVNAHIRPIGTDWTQLINADNAIVIVHAINYLPISGLIQAEDFDSQNGVQLEPTSDIGGGQNIGFIEDNDFVLYKVRVNETATYDFDFRVATNSVGGDLKILVDDVELGTLMIQNTGGWQSWTTISDQFDLTVGTYDLKFVFTGTAAYLFNINWVDIQKAIVTGKNPISTDSPILYPNPTKGIVHLSGNKSWKVSSYLGVLISEGKSNSIDLSSSPEGVYFVSIEGTTLKVIKRE